MSDSTPISFPTRRPPLPRRLSRGFAGGAAAVSTARTWLVGRLRTYSVPEETIETARLLLSELATNALRHTTGAGFHVGLIPAAGWLRVEVGDRGDGATRPHPRVVDADAECGRGLRLVDGLASRWGSVSPGHGLYVELAWTLPEPAPVAVLDADRRNAP